MSDIQVFKLTSGEELVARVSQETAQQLHLVKPLSLMPGPQGMALSQTLVSSDPHQDVILMSAAIAMRSVAREEMANAYIEATTGIKTAHPRVLMG